MQKLVFFIHSNDKNWGLASNICNLYMNRFTIDEDSGHEIDKIFGDEGVHTILPSEGLRYSVEDEERIGMGHIIIFFLEYFVVRTVIDSLELIIRYPERSFQIEDFGSGAANH